jgi:hypothetical protein
MKIYQVVGEDAKKFSVYVMKDCRTKLSHNTILGITRQY